MATCEFVYIISNIVDVPVFSVLIFCVRNEKWGGGGTTMYDRRITCERPQRNQVAHFIQTTLTWF